MSFKETQKRKADHITICLEKPVEFSKSNGFERFELVHRALPEIDFDSIDLSTEFLGKDFKLPFFIEAMTGGSTEAGKINRNLARAAQETGIGMGLGSQRAMLENPGLAPTYRVREEAPEIFLLGNIGGLQLKEYELSRIENALKEAGADGLAVHLNAAQELIQPEGKRNWSGILEKIREICSSLKLPVVVKETGCGISKGVARQLEDAGVSAIDTAGAGGTSWLKVESFRDERTRGFEEWGIPTAVSLWECVKTVDVPVIASGGIRTGLEAAKALAIGASLVGFALPLLRPATQSYGAVVKKIRDLEEELRIAMFLSGARNLEGLRKVRVLRVPEG